MRNWKFDDIAIEAGVDRYLFAESGANRTAEHAQQRIDQVRRAPSEERAFLVGHNAGRCIDEVLPNICRNIVDIGLILRDPYRCAKGFAGSVHTRIAPAFAGFDGCDRLDLMHRYQRWHHNIWEVVGLARNAKRKQDKDAIIRRDIPALLPEIADIARSVGGDDFRPHMSTGRTYFEQLRVPIPPWMQRHSKPNGLSVPVFNLVNTL